MTRKEFLARIAQDGGDLLYAGLDMGCLTPGRPVFWPLWKRHGVPAGTRPYLVYYPKKYTYRLIPYQVVLVADENTTVPFEPWDADMVRKIEANYKALVLKNHLKQL